MEEVREGRARVESESNSGLVAAPRRLHLQPLLRPSLVTDTFTLSFLTLHLNDLVPQCFNISARPLQIISNSFEPFSPPPRLKSPVFQMRTRDDKLRTRSTRCLFSKSSVQDALSTSTTTFAHDFP